MWEKVKEGAHTLEIFTLVFLNVCHTKLEKGNRLLIISDSSRKLKVMFLILHIPKLWVKLCIYACTCIQIYVSMAKIFHIKY